MKYKIWTRRFVDGLPCETPSAPLEWPIPGMPEGLKTFCLLCLTPIFAQAKASYQRDFLCGFCLEFYRSPVPEEKMPEFRARKAANFRLELVEEIL